MEKRVNDEYDPTVSSLLAMVEVFLSQNPPKVPEAVRCLLAVLSLAPPPRIEARTRLKLGLTLFHHTNNLLEAREHLDKAALMAQSAANLEEVRFEATSVSVRILVEQNCCHAAKSLLRGRIESSSHHPYWHVRLLLQLADVSMSERDEGGVISALNKCAEYARQVDAPYTRLLCSLSKGSFLLTHHRYQEAGEVLNHMSGLMEDYHGDKETLIRTFYLIVQVSHLLVAGQVKAAKPHLKQLQQRVKALSSEQCLPLFPSATTTLDSKLLAENFQWLTREQTFVMVYLVSVMHSVQGGYTDKALSYAEKALHFMPLDTTKDCGVVAVLRAHLLEQIIQCMLMKGETAKTADQIHEVLAVCRGHPQLIYSHRAVLHALLGLYAFATENLERATVQFHAALQHTNSGELRIFVSVNLALAYMKMGDSHNTELNSLIKSIDSDGATESCQSLRAAVHYVRGLYSFTQLKLHEAKRHLRETLLVSNKSDLNRLTTCSLILLGQIFLSVGNTKETMDMVSPAVQLSSKIPDKKLQVWAASLLADLYHLTGDQEKESSLRQQSATTANEIKNDLSAAVQSKHHSLIQWTVGEWPVSEKPRIQHAPFTNSKISSSYQLPLQPTPTKPASAKSKRRKTQESGNEWEGNHNSIPNEKMNTQQGDGSLIMLKDPQNAEQITTSLVAKSHATTPISSVGISSRYVDSSANSNSSRMPQPDFQMRDNLLAPAQQRHQVAPTTHTQPHVSANHHDTFAATSSPYRTHQPPHGDHLQQHGGNYDSHSPVLNQQLHQYRAAQRRTGDEGQGSLQTHSPAMGHNIRSPLVAQQAASTPHGQHNSLVAQPSTQPSPGSAIDSQTSPDSHNILVQHQQANLSPSPQPFTQQQHPNQHGVRLKSLQRPSEHGTLFGSASQPQVRTHVSSVPIASASQPQMHTHVHSAATAPASQSQVQAHAVHSPSGGIVSASQPQHGQVLGRNSPTAPYLANSQPVRSSNAAAMDRAHHHHYVQHQKQLEEGRLKQQHKGFNPQQQLTAEHHKQVGKMLPNVVQNTLPQKYFLGMDGQSPNYVQQHFQQQQQQQQQLIQQQQAHMQQQYLLQSGSTPSYTYQAMTPGGIDSRSPALGSTASPPQMPHLMHMTSQHQRAMLERSRQPSPSHLVQATQSPLGRQQQQYATYGQQLLPNGSNQPPSNPQSYSPLRHFNLH